MADWRKAKLIDIAAQKRWALNGGPFGSKLTTKHYTDSGVPVIRGGNLSGGARFSFEDFVWVSDEKADELLPNNAHPGDLVFTQRGTVGQVGLIPLDAPFKRFVISQSQMKLTPDPEKADALFLYYYFSSPATVKSIENLAFAAGVPHINLEIFRNFEVPLPPLPIQRRIAGILSAYDELIENSQRRIRLLEAMARSLYREWFVHFRFPGHEDHPRVASALGEIPAGWEGIFGDIAAIDRNSINPSDFPDERFEHFSIPAFDDGCTPAVELGKTILSNKYCIDDSCVLLSQLNPRIPRIWLPAPSGMMRAVTSTEFLTLKPKPGFTREFIYAKCCADEFVGQFASLAIGTSTSHQRVKPENLLSMPSTVPDRKVVEQFTKLVAPMLVISEKLRTKIQNLRQTRDLLLPRLLAGQVELEAVA